MDKLCFSSLGFKGLKRQNDEERDKCVSTDLGIIMQEPSEKMETEKRVLYGMVDPVAPPTLLVCISY